MGRRAFLASALASSGLAAAATGLVRRGGDASPPRVPNGDAFRDVIAEMQKRQRTIGDTLRATAVGDAQGGALIADSQPADAISWEGIYHALDMSNWLEAALLLGEIDRRSPPIADLRPGPLATVVQSLDALRYAWCSLVSMRRQWEEEYFVGYALGRMPSLAAGAPENPPFLGADPASRRDVAAIMELAPLFGALDISNQRFQAPGKTATGATIRCTQGHNYSYAHFANELQASSPTSKPIRTVLVNWDAHADLSDPSENPRTDRLFSLASLQAAESAAERVVAASAMSIAGWIAPLVHQGLLGTDDEGRAEIIWVVPPEAIATSHDCMEPYGSYEGIVGEWTLPSTYEAIAETSTTRVGSWNRPGERELRCYSRRPTLRSVKSHKVLRDAKPYVVHIVDPGDRNRLAALIGDAQIALSVDVDYMGVQEPGIRPRKGFLPHYPLNANVDEQRRHRQLVEQFEHFYDRFQQQMLAVSIANSPNFTVDEGVRRPVAKVLRIVAADKGAPQPVWVAGELRRATPPEIAIRSNWGVNALLAGGVAGIVAAAGLWRPVSPFSARNS